MDANAYFYAYIIGPLVGAFISIPFNCCINCAEDLLKSDEDKKQKDGVPVNASSQDRLANDDKGAGQTSALLKQSETGDNEDVKA